MTLFNNIIYEKEDHVALITLNNPPVNALNTGVLDELDLSISDFASSESLRVAIITAMGADVFIAGADIRELQSTPIDKVGKLINKGQALFDKIEKLPKIVIAAINGVCFGGGNELAMSCDIRIASENASFGQPEIKLGLIPGWGGIERLVKLAGKSTAQEMLLTGRPINAQKALQSGLIHKVTRAEFLIEQAKTLAQDLVHNAPLAVKYTKELLQRASFLSKSEYSLNERLSFEKLFSTDDAHEGIEAFLNRCLPSFKGQ